MFAFINKVNCQHLYLLLPSPRVKPRCIYTIVSAQALKKVYLIQIFVKTDYILDICYICISNAQIMADSEISGVWSLNLFITEQLIYKYITHNKPVDFHIVYRCWISPTNVLLMNQCYYDIMAIFLVWKITFK